MACAIGSEPPLCYRSSPYPDLPLCSHRCGCVICPVAPSVSGQRLDGCLARKARAFLWASGSGRDIVLAPIEQSLHPNIRRVGPAFGRPHHGPRAMGKQRKSRRRMAGHWRKPLRLPLRPQAWLTVIGPMSGIAESLRLSASSRILGVCLAIGLALQNREPELSE